MASLKRDAEDRESPATTAAASSSSPRRPFQCLPVYGQHKRAVSSVALAPSTTNGTGSSHSSNTPTSILCASASADGTVKLWDVSLEEPLPATTINPGGGALLTPVLESTFGHSRGINEVTWAKTGDPYLATASDDKTCRLWDATIGEVLVEFKGHDNFVFCCDFNPSSNLIVTGSFDETVKLWDVRSGECVSTLPAHSDPVTAVKFNRDGTCVVSASHDGLIRIWDVCTGECLKTIAAKGNPPVSHVSYSPNGKYLLAGTLDSTLRLWPITAQGKERCAKTYTTSPNNDDFVNHKYCIASRFLVAQPDQRQCVVTGSESGHVLWYDIQSRQLQQSAKVHQDAVLAVDTHNSVEFVASGGMSQDCTVRFWTPAPETSSSAARKRSRND